jgi:hypothetical protein
MPSTQLFAHHELEPRPDLADGTDLDLSTNLGGSGASNDSSSSGAPMSSTWLPSLIPGFCANGVPE